MSHGSSTSSVLKPPQARPPALVRGCAAALIRLGMAEHAQRLGEAAADAATSPLRVVVFGEFSSGKSTLINALLGRAALPARLRPTTGHAIRVIWGARPEAAVALRDGREQICSLDALAGFAALDVHSRAREDVARIEVRVPAPLLAGGLEIYDTPGTDDADAQTTRAVATVERADLALFVIRATQPLTMAARHLMEGWMSRELGKPVVPVVNFMNLVEPAERDETRRKILGWAERSLPAVLSRPCLEINALAAFRHVVGIPGSPAPADDFSRLLAALGTLTGPHGEKLRRDARLSRFRAAATAARRWNEPLLRRAAENAGTLHRQREAERREALDTMQRIERNAPGFRQRCLATAEEVFAKKFESLQERIRAAPNGPDLGNLVPAWFDDAAQAAIAAVEAEGDRLLHSLRERWLPTPEPLAVRELVQLDTRTQASAEAPDNSGAVGAGGLTGFALGTVLLMPVLGPLAPLASGALGAWLANRATRRQPDYATAHIAAGKVDWDRLHALTRDLLEAQFEVRSKALMAAAASRANALATMVPVAAEAELRASVQRDLAQLVGLSWSELSGSGM